VTGFEDAQLFGSQLGAVVVAPGVLLLLDLFRLGVEVVEILVAQLADREELFFVAVAEDLFALVIVALRSAALIVEHQLPRLVGALHLVER
jgi:hypothetical protein